MGCMKCGREIEEGQFFCDSCQNVMKKYPVKPDTAVQLPHRTEPSFSKKSSPRRRQAPNPEMQILRLRKWIRSLFLLWLVTLALLVATIYPAVRYFSGKPLRLPGQNYSTITSTETTAPPQSNLS